jgi:hypothetical protein
LSDLGKAISNAEKAVELTDDGHPSKPGHLSNLGASQLSRFQHPRSSAKLEDVTYLVDDGHPVGFVHIALMSDLKNAISNLKIAVELTDDGQSIKAMCLLNLGISQRTHFDSPCGNVTDLEASVTSFKTAAQLKSAYLHHTLSAA